MANQAAFPTAQPHNRLRTALPKLGIRPTIDGRYGGVRESLEDVTMGMALSVEQLVTSRLRHACGLPIEVVIAETCIGGAAEAAQCEERFRKEGVGVSLTVTPCWCYGSETMDMDRLRPKAIWGFNGTDRPGAVYLAATLAGHNQKGLPCFGIYGRDVQDLGDACIPDDVQDKILRFVRAGIAVASLKGTSYLAMGGVSMGIAGSIVSQELFERYFGMRVESVDMTEFVGRIENGIFDPDEYALAREWVRRNCQEGPDANPAAKRRSREQKEEDWDVSVKMALIARDLMVGNDRLAELGFHEQARGHNAAAGGFQGQRQWTDYFPNGDFLEAILCSSFDWSGIRQPFIVATENDSLNGISMLLGHLMTGGAQLFSDVRTYWSPESVKKVTGKPPQGRAKDGFLHLINSGPSALDWTGRQSEAGKPCLHPWWQVKAEEAAACLEDTQWRPSNTGYFPGGGWSTDFTTRGDMPCTMFRINLVQGLGPVLQIAEGFTLELDEETHRRLDERTDPTWPSTWFVPRLTGSGPFVDVYSVMANWGANHGAISFGHIGEDLVAAAAMLRVPVEMHNLDPNRLMRPTAWQRFGSGLDHVGGDFRACSAYGPLYA